MTKKNLSLNTNWWPVSDEEWEILNGFRPIPTKKEEKGK